MPIRRDPHIVLGIPRNADPCEIKRAYRRLVLELHPDVTGDSTKAPELLEVQRAYEALGEAAAQRSIGLRERPSQTGQADPATEESQPEPPRDPHAPSSLTYSKWRHGMRFHPEPFASPEAESLATRTRQVFSLVDELFGGIVLEVLPNRARSEPKDLFVELVLTRDEARNGGTFDMTVPVQKQCRACLGSGLGDMVSDHCPRCHGRGYDLEKREFEIVAPRDVKDGQETSLSIESDAGTAVLRVAVRVI